MLNKEHGMATIHDPELHNPARRIPAAAVRELCGGVSDMTLWRWMDRDPSFPRPAYYSKRRYWREADIIAWLDARELEHA
jgi:predicted DNA-binding transcriptional regulator AlpA